MQDNCKNYIQSVNNFLETSEKENSLLRHANEDSKAITALSESIAVLITEALQPADGYSISSEYIKEQIDSIKSLICQLDTDKMIKTVDEIDRLKELFKKYPIGDYKTDNGSLDNGAIENKTEVKMNIEEYDPDSKNE